MASLKISSSSGSLGQVLEADLPRSSGTTARPVRIGVGEMAPVLAVLGRPRQIGRTRAARHRVAAQRVRQRGEVVAPVATTDGKRPGRSRPCSRRLTVSASASTAAANSSADNGRVGQRVGDTEVGRRGNRLRGPSIR